MSRSFLVLLAVLSLLSLSAASSLVPHSLRIEHLDVATHPDLVLDTCTPLFSWQLTDEGVRGLTQSAYQLQVLAQQPDGSMLLTADEADTGKVASNASTNVAHPYCLSHNTRYLLRVRYWSSTGRESEWAQATFRTALGSAWRDSPAQWIGSTTIPMHQLRKDFTLPSSPSVTSATLSMSGIGYSTLYINGKAVDPSRKLDPGWTTYEKRTLYVSFAVESFLQAGGVNALSIELGSGWFSQEQYRDGAPETYGPPRLWLQLTVTHADNSTTEVYSDASWLGSTGPTVHDGVYMGSIVDHRWQRDGWMMAGWTDPTAVWINATALPSPLDSTGVLSLQYMDPIRTAPDNLHVATSGNQGNPAGVVGGDLIRQNGGVIQPTEVGGASEGQPSDLGQNIAGWCQMKIRSKRGMSVLVRYSETQSLKNNPQVAESLYTENLRNAASTDIFINGQDDVEETFVPPFTIHGFRYFEVRGAKNELRPEQVQCLFVHTETKMVGNFTHASTVMNQIQHNILWGQLSNMMSLPSDCPQRDERKGWMGDAGLTVDESLYNFDSANFYRNFLDLIHDIQTADGQVSDTVPITYGRFPADPNWGTAYPTIVWYMYDHYGDVSIVQKHYQWVKMWTEYLRSGWKQNGLAGIENEYGDWVPPPPETQSDPALIASFPFLRDVLTVGKMAALLNDTDTAKDYAVLYTQLVADFNKQWYQGGTTGYADGKQTANALALALPGLVEKANVDGVVKALVTDIIAHGTHFTTGIVGVAQLFPVLSAHGQHDLALKLAQQTTYPSYGYMFSNAVENATTLWELWDSPNEGPSMNSRNHIMFGSIGAWFYRDVAGVRLNALQEVEVRPRMPLDLTLSPSLAAEVVTVKGSVHVQYERSAAGAIDLTVTIPLNTNGRVVFEPLLAGGRCSLLKEGESVLYRRAAAQNRHAAVAAVDEVAGVAAVAEEADTGVMHVQLGAGTYRFTALWE